MHTLEKKLLTTKRCCYGVFRSDYRYGHREHMKGATFMTFLKPHMDRDKCKRWIRACRRDGFGEKRFWCRRGYQTQALICICSLHFYWGSGQPSNPQIPSTQLLHQLKWVTLTAVRNSNASKQTPSSRSNKCSHNNPVSLILGKCVWIRLGVNYARSI